MSGRLIIAIVSTIAEEAAVLVISVWLLPKIGVEIPWPVIAAIMSVWLGFSIFTYWKGTGALLRKPVHGMTNMVGSVGTVVKSLNPDGFVKIKGELWGCISENGGINEGIRVIVVKQEGLRLVVRPDPAVFDKQSKG
jgi:membrane-bound ClpP family serine protease